MYRSDGCSTSGSDWYATSKTPDGSGPFVGSEVASSVGAVVSVASAGRSSVGVAFAGRTAADAVDPAGAGAESPARDNATNETATASSEATSAQPAISTGTPPRRRCGGGSGGRKCAGGIGPVVVM